MLDAHDIVIPYGNKTLRNAKGLKMKVKSTGLANANMDVYIKSINSVMEDGRQFLQIDMDVTRPRNWKVVAKIGRDDLLVLLRQVFAPSVIFTTIYMLARNKDSDRK